MASFILSLAMLLAGVSIVSYIAGDFASHGAAWATDLCSVGSVLCDHSQVAGVAAMGMGGLGLLLKIISGLR